MARSPTPILVASLALALLGSACSEPRPAQNGSQGGLDTCVYCHGTVGRVGNLPGTDPRLASAPPAAPAGKPDSVVGAHQAHLNPPISGALRTPIACGECHVVPQNLGHATNPPANPVIFGAVATARGASPQYDPVALGCAAVYCHGNFDYGGVKGKVASVTWNGGTVGCGDCHALPPTGHPALAGTVTRATCNQCHPDTVNPDGTINVNAGAHINGRADVVFDCTSCHGTAGRQGFQSGTDANLAAAPPEAPAGAPTYAVGAHQSHLNPPLAGSMGAPIQCAECHVVPTTPDHASSPPANPVAFGSLATTGGASPTFDATTSGCAATYCHGNFAFNGVRGLGAAPLWTDVGVGCGSCHGMPPAGHPALAGTVTPATCSTCHPGTVSPDGSINLAGGGHLNGRPDVLLDCTSCHGDPSRAATTTNPLLPASPPVAPRGAPAYAVGAHLNHLLPPATGAFRGAVACNECHVVPADSSHATNPPPQRVVFGTLATTGGTVPAFDATTSGCSATYCHGAFNLNGVTGKSAAPLWTDTGLTCTSCHDLPPAGHPPLAGTVTAATCNQCHPSTVNPDGTINVAGNTHVNGHADVAVNCTSCHGTAGRIGFLAGTDPQLAAAPPLAVAGAPASSGTVHQFHVNPPSNGSFRGPLLCNECHVVPADATHATSPPASPVVFGALSRTQGNSPTWNAATLGCAATYCHGGFDFNGVRGVAATPLWSTTTLTCTDCHGLPPTGHPQLAGTVTASTCAQCHPSTVNANGTINVAGGKHVNGLADVAASCTACHGDPTRTVPAGNPNALLAAAPPVAPPGFPATVVGTHLLHLTDSAIRSAITCDNCHVVPANADHSIQFPAPVVFTQGTLATTQGVVPTYSASAMTCSTVYCHGAFAFSGITGNATATPAWSATPTLACTGCHGMPPTGHSPAGPLAATDCAACHPATVKADGTIDVAGGKHMNGAAEFLGGHPAGWADPTQHGYGANAQGLPSCTTCHVAFGTASGVAGSSCNDCHTANGHAGWQTECTFCHGTPGRAATATNPQLAAAPPVDSQGNGDATTPRTPGVGAHSKHLLTMTVSSAFACGNCHESTLPTNVTHVDGTRGPIPFGLLAVTGNVTPSYSLTTTGCATVYCHGAFGTNGQPTAVPVWTSTTAMTCTSCHKMPATNTGEHFRHLQQSINCSECHSGIATGTANSSGVSTNAQIVGAAQHVNGTINVVFGSGISITTSGTGSSRTCTGTCHSQGHSSERW